MGFKALNQAGDAVYSFTMDDHQWKEFKSKHKQQYKMSCCDAVATPKTSAKGTQFFSHHSQGNCNHKPESAEHMFCKYMLILALRDIGWNVETERRGQAPSGEVWIADVYAEKENAKVVFEVQWSGITLDEITRRNNKYIKSGVRCVWLKKAKMKDSWNKQFELLYHSNRELTIFGFEKDESDFYVFGFHDLDRQGRKIFDSTSLSLCKFVSCLFDGRIKLNTSIVKNTTAAPVLKKFRDCINCGSSLHFHEYSIICDADSGKRLYIAPNHWVDIEDIGFFYFDKNVSSIINNGAYKGFSVFCHDCSKSATYKSTSSYSLEANSDTLPCKIKPNHISSISPTYDVFWVYLDSQD